MSPLHCGYWRRNSDGGRRWKGGFRRTARYGRDEYCALTLGTAMAISGAAASPNMGYNSSPIVTFLMTLANARLGWWLGNPLYRPDSRESDPPAPTAGRVKQAVQEADEGIRQIVCPKEPYERSAPYWSLRYFLTEAFGRTGEEKPYVYLSDGGHFDNLGIYEMVRRRCRYIVAVDATADPSYDFGSLAHTIRKVRVDLGVDIDFGSGLEAFGARSGGAHYALGRILYGGQSRPQDDGWLLYLKASSNGDEPADILHYAKSHPTFPHESTANQWFSETQFEGYRCLGEHVVDSVARSARDMPDSPLANFLKMLRPIACS